MAMMMRIDYSICRNQNSNYNCDDGLVLQGRLTINICMNIQAQPPYAI